MQAHKQGTRCNVQSCPHYKPLHCHVPAECLPCGRDTRGALLRSCHDQGPEDLSQTREHKRCLMQIADFSVRTVCFQGYFTADDYSFQASMFMPVSLKPETALSAHDMLDSLNASAWQPWKMATHVDGFQAAAGFSCCTQWGW